MNNTYFLKILIRISIIALLTVYSILLTANGAEGYELNLFAMYSPFFWLLFFSGIAVSVIIIVLSVYWHIDRYWKISYVSIIAMYILFLLLPYLRGYYLFARGTSDVFHHLKYSQYIVNTGSTSTYYPISHILLAILHYLGLDMETAASLIPVIFSVLVILFVSVLGTTLHANPKNSLFSILFSLPLLYGMFHRTFHPYFFALFFIPLFYYLLLRSLDSSRMKENLVLLIITSFFIIFTHPLVTIILIGFIFTFFLVNTFIPLHHYTISKKNWNDRLLFVLSILAISFCSWYLSFQLTLKNIRKVIYTFIDNPDSTETILEYQTELVTSSDAHPFYIIRLFILKYGPIFSYLILAALCCVILLFLVKKRRVSDYELIFSAKFMYGVSIAIIFVSGYFIVFEPIRAAAPAILLSTIIIPLVVSQVFSRMRSEKGKIFFFSAITLFLIAVITISLLNIFSSPVISEGSLHMTYMEKDGLDWFFHYQDEITPLVGFGNTRTYKKYESFFYEKNDETGAEERIEYSSKVIPSHFGYDNHLRLRDAMNMSEFYFISTEYNRQSYLAVPEDRRERLSKLTDQDFTRLKRDDSVNQIYANGEFESWLITGG